MSIGAAGMLQRQVRSANAQPVVTDFPSRETLRLMLAGGVSPAGTLTLPCNEAAAHARASTRLIPFATSTGAIQHPAARNRSRAGDSTAIVSKVSDENSIAISLSGCPDWTAIVPWQRMSGDDT